ncbi:MAG: hypothetical protein KAY22_16935 [Rhizorhabdus sp.]|uniref:hypothetical protein n=1 Tax=Rhizorhabdus sp. TaxID=1968843 RepID=UPI001B4A9652|nr:hypothetical protein [Rhizorhabdus sp.]MBP8233985.1 hypothetical protein [Rhizorhabdus sp.]
MTLQLSELTSADIWKLAHRLSLREKLAFERLAGAAYDPAALAVRLIQNPGISFAGRDDMGEVQAAGGFQSLRPGVWRTWFMATEDAWRHHGAAVTEITAGVIARMLAEDLAHRIETVTLADAKVARRWYERIGLSYESTLRGYVNVDTDAVMYAAVKTQERA